MDNGPGWLPDPEHEGQERYWDGSDWTAQVRPAGSLGSLHLPEHLPELQRALAAATADIDEVEDRLSSLFKRTGSPSGAGAVHRRATVVPDGDVDVDEDVDVDADSEVATDSDVDADSEVDEDEDEDEDLDLADEDEFALHEEFEDEDEVEVVEAVDEEEAADDDAMAELDAALAAEAPDKPERRFFRRKS